MKLSFLNLRTRSQLKKNKSERSSTPFKHAQSIGIIFTVEDRKKHEEIKEFVHRLEQEGKKVTVLAFLPKNTDNYQFLFDFFSLQDISFWGEITAPNAQHFYNTPFDYIYYLDFTPNPIILNVLARSKAKCRIGRHWDSSQAYFEMMINTVANIKSLIEGMYTYSTKLR